MGCNKGISIVDLDQVRAMALSSTLSVSSYTILVILH